MEIIGKLIKKLPDTSGESEKGKWVRGGFVIEYQDGDYPTNAAFTLFGESRINSIKSIPENSTVRVQYSIRSREYQDRWYTDLSCYRVEPYNQPMPMQGAPVYGQPYQNAVAPGYAQPYPQQGFQQPMQQPYQQQAPAYQQPQPVQQPQVYPDAQAQEWKNDGTQNNFQGGGDAFGSQSANQEDDLPF